MCRDSLPLEGRIFRYYSRWFRLQVITAALLTVIRSSRENFGQRKTWHALLVKQILHYCSLISFRFPFDVDPVWDDDYLSLLAHKATNFTCQWLPRLHAACLYLWKKDFVLSPWYVLQIDQEERCRQPPAYSKPPYSSLSLIFFRLRYGNASPTFIETKSYDEWQHGYYALPYFVGWKRGIERCHHHMQLFIFALVVQMWMAW